MLSSVLPAPVGLVGLAGYLKRHPLPDPGAISPLDRKVAREIWADIKAEHGFMRTATPLLTPPTGNAKIKKSERLVWSLTLAPAASSGINTCVRYADCVDVCVLTSGKGALPAVQRIRNARTALLYRAPGAFAVLLADEVDRAAREADGQAWGLRPNAASDIPWEHAAPWLLRRVRDLGGLSYDYTKAWGRSDALCRSLGYSLTRSVDSRHDDEAIYGALRRGENVAVVLPVSKGAPVPAEWHGFAAVDGDVSDARCDDTRGVVVVLRAKGKLRNNTIHPLVREV